MKLFLIDVLCCPLCKESLDLIVLSWSEKTKSLVGEEFLDETVGRFEEVKGKLSSKIGEDRMKDMEIDHGVLYCRSCKRWYPIGCTIRGIPELYYPDKLRDRRKELRFLKKWADKLPDEILYESLPWNLSESSEG
ncbi:MAG: Trm112 family protein [Candidatus Asgardarchaeia archaeon]